MLPMLSAPSVAFSLGTVGGLDLQLEQNGSVDCDVGQNIAKKAHWSQSVCHI
jgi:hypothetical protein